MKKVRLYFGVSMERGIEGYMFTSMDYYDASYINFLRKLNLNTKPKPVLFVDNASYHGTPAVQAFLKDKNVKQIHNLSYRPDLNAVEYVFSALKSIFKRLRLQKVAR